MSQIPNKFGAFIVGAMLCVQLYPPCTQAKRHGGPTVGCRQWDQRVDPTLGKTGVELDRTISDKEFVEAVACLLKHKGDHRLARFGGATNPGVSQILPGATIELAALYYISYIFTGNWHHADGVALWNEDGVINPPGAIERAYSSYAKWFKVVQSLGLSAARKKHLDPLEGTKLRWYGK